MVPMRVREVRTCPSHRWTIVVLEDVERRHRLCFHADAVESGRLARVLAHRDACQPIYEFVQALLEACRATPTRVVLDDVDGAGIGGCVYVRLAGSELGIPCYPPDALALAVRARLPVYATAAALAHAEPLSPQPDGPGGPRTPGRWH